MLNVTTQPPAPKTPTPLETASDDLCEAAKATKELLVRAIDSGELKIMVEKWRRRKARDGEQTRPA